MLFFLLMFVAICAVTNAFRMPTRGLIRSSLFRVKYANEDKKKNLPSTPPSSEIFTQEKAMHILHEMYDKAKQMYDSPEAQKALEVAKQNLEKGSKIAFDRSVEDIPKAIEIEDSDSNSSRSISHTLQRALSVEYIETTGNRR